MKKPPCTGGFFKYLIRSDDIPGAEITLDAAKLVFLIKQFAQLIGMDHVVLLTVCKDAFPLEFLKFYTGRLTGKAHEIGQILLGHRQLYLYHVLLDIASEP